MARVPQGFLGAEEDMMIDALPIDEVLGSMVTDDGQHTLIQTRTGGNESVLAFPIDQLFNLIDLFAVSASQAATKSGEPKEIKRITPATWFEVGGRAETGSVVLSLTFGAGGTLSFEMPRSMAEQLRETLNVHLGGSMPETPFIPRH